MTRPGVSVLVGLLLMGGCATDDTSPTAASDQPTTTLSVGRSASDAPGRPDQGAGQEAQVVRVTDGDTLVVALPDGTERDVRLVGVNAPERGECLADQATAELTRLVRESPVRLEVDTTDEDQYGRLLRYVFTGDVHVNAVLVASGLALSYAYEPDTARQAELDRAEADARGAERGRWAPDACGPATTAEVRIAAVEPDAPGDDGQNLNGEWVVIANAGTGPVDLTGWGISDETASHRYEFPSGFTLAPGAEARVLTGCGVDTARDLYWCEQGSTVWNNSGDTVFLTDLSGNTVDDLSYP